MSVVSVNLPGHVGISVAESPVGIPAPDKSPNQLGGYRESTPKSDAVEKASTQSRETPGERSGCVRN